MDSFITTPRRPWANLSYQRAFDTMLAHLREQGQPAMTEKGGCRYRLGDLKCAVGALIPDSEYRASFDLGEGFTDITRLLGGSLQLQEFLLTCQVGMHDRPAFKVRRGYDGTFLDHVEEGAQKIARRYNLQYQPPPVALDG